MAQRQLARRLVGLGSSICRARCTVRAVTAVRAFPTQHQPLYRAAAALHTTTPRHNANIINIQDEDDFKKRVIASTTPVIVDFHAGWCGPCKMLGPRLESMISERDGKVVLAKVDIDENSDLAMEHGVEAVPTVLAMKDGNIIDKFIGMKDDASLESFIDGLVR